MNSFVICLLNQGVEEKDLCVVRENRAHSVKPKVSKHLGSFHDHASAPYSNFQKRHRPPIVSLSCSRGWYLRSKKKKKKRNLNFGYKRGRAELIGTSIDPEPPAERRWGVWKYTGVMAQLIFPGFIFPSSLTLLGLQRSPETKLYIV